jgi:hypothetical protein
VRRDVRLRAGFWLVGVLGCSGHAPVTVASDAAALVRFAVDFTIAAPLPPDSGLVGDYSVSCLPGPPSEGDAGPECTITVTVPGEAPCSSYPGLQDPDGPGGAPTATTTIFYGVPSRVCEVQELEGADQQACASWGPCSSCAPGWCVVTVSNEGCPFIRYGPGTLPASGYVQVECDIAVE